MTHVEISTHTSHKDTSTTATDEAGEVHRPSTSSEDLSSASKQGALGYESANDSGGGIPSRQHEATLSTVEPPALEPSLGVRMKATEHQPLLFNRVDRYTLLSELGRGGMGVVYRAWDPQLDRTVALKMLLWSGVAGEVRRRRFKREAQAIARLEHPGIVRVYDSGVHQGSPFYTMDYVAGLTLAQQLEKQGRFAPEAALKLVAAVARALSHAHARGIVHRDVKPGNILLADDRTPRISDFGIAQFDFDEGELTRTGQVMGTPAYMAPEQALGLPGGVGPAADVYALGGVLFQLLTGRLPSADTSDPTQALEGPSPRSHVAQLPREVEQICRKAMAPKPEDRYASAEALAEDAERFLRGEPVWAVAPSLWRQLRWQVQRRRALLTGAMMSLLLALLALGGWRLFALWQAQEQQEARERVAAQRLDALKGQRMLLREQQDEQGAERALEAFLELSDVQGTRAPAQVLLEEGQHLLETARHQDALIAFARAWVLAETPTQRLSSLLGMASGFEALGDWRRFQALQELIRRAAKQTASEESLLRYERHLALSERDLPLLRSKLGPQARSDFAGLLEQLGTMRRTGIKTSYLPYAEQGGVVPYLATANPIPSTVIMDYGAGRNPSLPLREVVSPPGTGVSSALLNLGWDSGVQYVATQIKNHETGKTLYGIFKIVNRQMVLVQELNIADLVGGLAVDLDGDGRQEVYLAGGRVLFRLDLLPNGLFQFRVAHSETSRSNSDMRGIMAADLDGDGRPELVVGTGTWRAYDVRVFRPDPQGGELRMVAQRRMGTSWGLAPLPLVEGRMGVAVTRFSNFPNTRTFPAETPMGYPLGTYLLSLRDNRLELERYVPSPFNNASLGRVVSGDFDGDGRHELAIQIQLSYDAQSAFSPDHSYLQLVRQRADGTLSQLLLPGLVPWQALNLDDDPASELIVLDRASEALWVLGAGSEPLPPLTDVSSRVEGLSPERSAREAQANERSSAATDGTSTDGTATVGAAAGMEGIADESAFEDAIARIEVLTALGLSQAGMRELRVVAATSPEVEAMVETLTRAAGLMKSGENDREAEALYQLILKRVPDALPALRGLVGIYRERWNVPEERRMLQMLLASPELPPAERLSLLERRAWLERLGRQEKDALQLDRGVDPRLLLRVPGQVRRDPIRRSLEVRVHTGQGDVVTAPLRWTGERLTVETLLHLRRGEWGSMLRLGLRRRGKGHGEMLLGVGIHVKGGGNYLISTISPFMSGQQVRPIWEQPCLDPDQPRTFKLGFALERGSGKAYFWVNDAGWAYQFEQPISGEPEDFELVIRGDEELPPARGVLEASIERLTLDGATFTQTPLDVEEQARHALSNGDYETVRVLAERIRPHNPTLSEHLLYVSQCRSGAFEACRRSFRGLLRGVGRAEPQLHWLLWDQLYTSPALVFPTWVEEQGYEALRRLEQMWGLLAHAHPDNLMVLLTVSTSPSDEDFKKLPPPQTSEERTMIFSAYVRRLRAWLLLRRYDLTIASYEEVRTWGLRQLPLMTEPGARATMRVQLVELERTVARAYAFKGLPVLVLRHLEEALRMSPTPRLVAEELAVLPEISGLMREPGIAALLQPTTYVLPKRPPVGGLDE